MKTQSNVNGYGSRLWATLNLLPSSVSRLFFSITPPKMFWKGTFLEKDDQQYVFFDDLVNEMLYTRLHVPETLIEIADVFEQCAKNCRSAASRQLESPIEHQFWECAHSVIPDLIYQYPVGHYRLDFAIPQKKIGIELDGHEYHKTKEQRTHDAKRDRDLRELGWSLLRFTGTEIYQNVKQCVEQIQMILQQYDREEYHIRNTAIFLFGASVWKDGKFIGPVPGEISSDDTTE